MIVISPNSFDKVKNWLAESKQWARPEATFMLFGNKSDLEAEG